MDYYSIRLVHIYTQMKNTKRPYFTHFVIEVQTQSDTNSIKWIKKKTTLLLDSLKIKSVKEISHKFDPHGISFVNILSSSHIAIHSWPEKQYLHIDLVTCTKNLNKKFMENVARKVFLESRIIIHELSY